MIEVLFKYRRKHLEFPTPRLFRDLINDFGDLEEFVNDDYRVVINLAPNSYDRASEVFDGTVYIYPRHPSLDLDFLTVVTEIFRLVALEMLDRHVPESRDRFTRDPSNPNQKTIVWGWTREQKTEFGSSLTERLYATGSRVLQRSMGQLPAEMSFSDRMMKETVEYYVSQEEHPPKDD